MIGLRIFVLRLVVCQAHAVPGFARAVTVRRRCVHGSLGGLTSVRAPTTLIRKLFRRTQRAAAMGCFTLGGRSRASARRCRRCCCCCCAVTIPLSFPCAMGRARGLICKRGLLRARTQSSGARSCEHWIVFERSGIYVPLWEGSPRCRPCGNIGSVRGGRWRTQDRRGSIEERCVGRALLYDRCGTARAARTRTVRREQWAALRMAEVLG